MEPLTSKGIYYWPTYKAAQDALNHARNIQMADKNSRIVSYGLDWAVQIYKSGPYLGPLSKQIEYPE